MGDEEAEKYHHPVRRKELSELMQQHSHMRGIPYNESWREFDRRFLKIHHAAVYDMKRRYCEDHHTELTLPAFLEETNWLAEALEIAREMTRCDDEKLRGA